MYIEDSIWNCLFCNIEFKQPIRKQGGGSRKLYCSINCCKKAWLKGNLEKRQASVRKYDKKKDSVEKKKERARKATLRKYNLNEDNFFQLLNNQNNKCLGCFKDINRYSARIDHCHTTGKVRGLLCDHCNWAIGHAKDDAKILYNLGDYLILNA